MESIDFRRMSFYQIWTRSFCDGNGDGIGDLYGVYEKLEYIKSLGVDGIWFSPIFPSPNADYGYDISDYKDIHPDYGTLDQFKRVLDKAHSMGLKVLLDLVINHTSDEHPWFQESCKGKDNPYSEYYIWRDPLYKGETRLPPNNWFSQFEGLAWEYQESREQYYLHVFARKQPDLNMDNPKVREEVRSIMRFWLDLGVDGFREDVIVYISKTPNLPNGYPFLPAINGLPYYAHGPNLLGYLSEYREVAKEYGALQVGEAPFTSPAKALKYLTGSNPVLDMVIQFDAMGADCFLTEYVHLPFSLRRLKAAYTKWQRALDGKAWNALYLENHDHPRVISRYGSEEFWEKSGTALAASYLFQQGTPFLYQGQEIGMLNIELPSIDDYLDVASINAFHTFHKHQSMEKRMRRIYQSSRDSSRTPMQWTAGENAGFTTGTPWFFVNPNYPKINVEAEEKDPQSILWFYRRCLQLRKETPCLLWGDYREYQHWKRHLYLYGRTYEGVKILVLISFSKKDMRYHLPRGYREGEATLLLGNYEGGQKQGTLRPYEVKLLKWGD